MADKIPIRGGFNGGSLTGLAQFASGDTLGVAHGGTGIVTIGSNQLVTGNGTSAITSESDLTFNGTTLATTAFTATGNVSLDGGTFVFNDSGADKDFRIEGDTDTELFIADASTNRIGIGTLSPTHLLDVNGVANVSTCIVTPKLCIPDAGMETTGYVLPAGDGSAGQLMCTDGSGALAFATASGGVALAGSTNNTIATVTGADALCGEANLTFDGTSTFALTSTTNPQILRMDLDTGSGRSYHLRNNSSGQFGIYDDDASAVRFQIDSAGVVRVYSSSTAAFNPDAGTGLPSLVLHNTAADTDNQNVGIGFELGSDGSNGQARIDAVHNGTGSATELVFSTRNSSGNLLENWRITDTGQLTASHKAAMNNIEYINVNTSTTAASSPIMTLASNTTSSAQSTNGVIRIHQEASPNANFRAYVYTQSSSNTQVFRVMGDGDVENANNSYGSTSDLKLKQDITDARSYWDDLKSLQFKKFRYKKDVEEDADAPYRFGLIAQEVEPIFPGIVKTNQDNEIKTGPVLDGDGNATYEMTDKINDDGEVILDDDGNAVRVQLLDDEDNPIPIIKEQTTMLETTTKSLKYSVLSQIGLKVVQELQTRLEAAETLAQELQTRLEATEAEIAILKG